MNTGTEKHKTAAHCVPEERTARRIIICAGTGCVANGSLDVYDRFMEVVTQRGLRVSVEYSADDNSGKRDGHVHLSRSGCQGFCQMGPLVTVLPQDVLYTRVRPADVDEIVETTICSDNLVERLLYRDPSTAVVCSTPADIPFYAQQTRTVLDACGRIDPESIDEYLGSGGYTAARRVFRELEPTDVCRLVADSGLRGRGGGGFPTGRKWELTRTQPGKQRYVVCNGDEGDPGAFMDRSLMEGNPHRVLEGIMIASRAVGADEAYIYVRLEYPLAVERLRKAVNDAENRGILGENVFGTGLAVTCHVVEGAGAFVCGEETALLASIEGRRGMPTPKPPFPAQSGLRGCPTLINNVETLATVPLLFRDDMSVFRSVGTKASPGTKTFALTGHVANTGLIEVPLGTTLRTIVYDIGGGVTDNQGNLDAAGFKAVQIGGPSGGCLTREHLDLPLDYDSLQQVGAMVGSGGLVVMNHQTCMVSVARFFMKFTQNESCGKCVPCREGTKQMLMLLDDITEGRADAATLQLLERLALAVRKGALCGLGKTAPSPVLSTLRYFREEYEAHVIHKYCPVGQCRALVKPEIDPEVCIGCGACARKCPAGAISGQPKQPYTIDPELCTRCGVCASVCRFDAVRGV